jgi:hypothetical protein
MLDSDLAAEDVGFIVHLEKLWLGASPDAWVTDPSSELVTGLVEIKCPYTKADMFLEVACQDPNFYCLMIDNKLHFKSDHNHVRLQINLITRAHQYSLIIDVCGIKLILLLHHE